MSDDRLRKLENRWRQESTLQNEVAYLLERIRVGDLTRHQVNLACYLEHPAAIEIAEKKIV